MNEEMAGKRDTDIKDRLASGISLLWNNHKDRLSDGIINVLPSPRGPVSLLFICLGVGEELTKPHYGSRANSFMWYEQ